MIGITDVCKNCPDRHEACWGGCPKYQQAKAEHDKQKQARAQAINRNCALNSVQYHGLKTKKKER